MAWKKTLFGYSEEEVKDYLGHLETAWQEEQEALAAQVAVAEEKNTTETAALALLRAAAKNRQDRLSAVEKRLTEGYYALLLSLCRAQALASQAAAEKEKNAKERAKLLGEIKGMLSDVDSRLEAFIAQGNWQREKNGMEKKAQFTKSLLGLAPDEVQAYLDKLEAEHCRVLAELQEKLDVFEESLTMREKERDLLKDLLQQPKMQPEFVDLAEKFLDRFEDVLYNTADRLPAMPMDNLNRQERDNIRQEKALRQQIARCRRKLKMLLRALQIDALPQERSRRYERIWDEPAYPSQTGKTPTKGRKYGARPYPPGSPLSDVGAGRPTGGEGSFSDVTEAANQVVQAAGLPSDDTTEAKEKAQRKPKPASTLGGGITPAPVVSENAPSLLRFRYLKGKKAGAALTDQGGQVLICRGEDITPAVAERIWQAGMLDLLVRDMES